MDRERRENYSVKITDLSGGFFWLDLYISNDGDVYIAPRFQSKVFRKNKRKVSLHSTGQSHSKWDITREAASRFSKDELERLSKQIITHRPGALGEWKKDNNLLTCLNATVHQPALHTGEIECGKGLPNINILLEEFNALEVLFVTHRYKSLVIPEAQGYKKEFETSIPNSTLTLFSRQINLTGREEVFKSLVERRFAIESLTESEGLIEIEGSGPAILGKLFTSNSYIQKLRKV